MTGITIGVDVDEVLANYLEGLRDYLNDTLHDGSLTQEELDELFPLDTKAFGLPDWEHIGGDHTQFVKYHSAAVEGGLLHNLTPVEGGKEWVNKLKDEGNHIRIITSRFVKNGQHSIVLRDTSQWLDNQGIKYDDIAFTAKKTDIQADIYVDDGPDNIKNFIQADKDFIIFDFSYNRELEGLRAHNWEDTYTMIQKLKLEKQR